MREQKSTRTFAASVSVSAAGAARRSSAEARELTHSSEILIRIEKLIQHSLSGVWSQLSREASRVSQEERWTEDEPEETFAIRLA